MSEPIKEEIDELIKKLNEQMKIVESLRNKVYSEEKGGFYLTKDNENDFKRYVNEHAKVANIVKELQEKFLEYHNEG